MPVVIILKMKTIINYCAWLVKLAPAVSCVECLIQITFVIILLHLLSLKFLFE